MQTHLSHSKLMSVLRSLGFDKLAWSFRRLHCPVKKDDLVLEVGSGSSPYYRSNILCDAYEQTQERWFTPLVTDRPTVIAFGENLPFRDKSFDFVIASHVLEHSEDPERFLEELQRVAKSGYIEVPDAFMERLTHYTFHKLEIAEQDDQLLITKKKNYIHDEEVVRLFKNKARGVFPAWVSKFPFNFHVRYYWSDNCGGINYKILNPDTNLDWDVPQLSISSNVSTEKISTKIKRVCLILARKLLSQRQRNRTLELLPLLQCSSCKSKNLALKENENFVFCDNCGGKIQIYRPK